MDGGTGGEGSQPPQPSGGTGSSEVAGDLDTYQGKYVDIGLDTNNNSKVDDWEVFYATTDRIFLIAADYVPVTKLEEWKVIGEDGTLDSNGFKKYDENYRVYWPSTPTDFLDLPDLNLVMHTGYDLTEHETQPNSIAVSHLLNTTAWDGIKEAAGKKDSIDFVIGGPTLEMWCAAWKEAIEGNGDNLVVLEADPQTSGNGYKVKYNGTSAYYWYVNGSSSSGPAADILDKYKTFFPHSAVHDNCYGYWLASPSANGYNYLLYVGYGGNVSVSGYDDGYLGLRPVVCLGSGVSLVESAGTGKYTLSKSDIRTLFLEAS